MDLASLLICVLEQNRARINAAAERFDGPIALELSWHPTMRKVEAVIRPSDRLPPFRVGGDKMALEKPPALARSAQKCTKPGSSPAGGVEKSAQPAR